MKIKPINLAVVFGLTLIWGCLATGISVASDIYFFIDEQGVYHYSNAPTSSRYVPSNLHFSRESHAAFLSEQDYDRLIDEAAAAHGVEFALVKAIIKAESGFNPRAVSHAGAMGLMQIMPANLTSFNLSDPFDPGQNIHAGTRYIKLLLDRYSEDLNMALAAYNAGPGVVDQYRGIPPYQETQKYIERVLSYYDRYSRNQP